MIVFGHSYVRDLARHVTKDSDLILPSGERVTLQFQLSSLPEKDYGYFMEHPEKVNNIREVNPDVVIVVLRGNYLTASLFKVQITQKAAEFYALLKAAVGPGCLRLAVQVGPRFVPGDN